MSAISDLDDDLDLARDLRNASATSMKILAVQDALRASGPRAGRIVAASWPHRSHMLLRSHDRMAQVAAYA